MARDIRQTIENLIKLAERPGSPGEGVAAREQATRLAKKYGIIQKTSFDGPEPGRTRHRPPANPDAFYEPYKPKPSPYQPLLDEFEKVLLAHHWVLIKKNGTSSLYRNKSCPNQEMQVGIFPHYGPLCRHVGIGRGFSLLFMASNPRKLVEYFRSVEYAIENATGARMG